jgi:hypothetical protein
LTVVEASPLNLSAVTLNGKATVLFPGRSYTRVVRTIAMFNTQPGRVTIYRGTIGAFTFVAFNATGVDQTYNIPFKLPSGQGVFIVWDGALPVPVSSARAVLTWMESK